MSTIEGGMVSTNDKNIYEFSRIIRSHGMNREHDNLNLKKKKHQKIFKSKQKILYFCTKLQFKKHRNKCSFRTNSVIKIK